MTFPFHDWFPHDEFDATYGYDLDALLRVRPVRPPDGFDEFWLGRFDEAAQVPADPVLAPLGEQEGRQVFDVEHTVSGGLRLHGWYASPVDDVAPRVGVVVGHGYGGRSAPAFERVPEDASVFFPVARGLPAPNAGVGAPLPEHGHVLHGIDSVDDHVLGWCAADLWHAATALVEIAGELPLYYLGESFGGGIGALALPWDDRFVGATLNVPTFGQYDLRLTMQCLGSGERVRDHVAAHPEAREVLRFFDASSAAGFAGIPVRAECALYDGYVPPPGQFAVANGFSDLELEVLPAGHAEYPGHDAVTARCRAAALTHLDRATAASGRASASSPVPAAADIR
ncbi:acetylxylan esterase [Microbacterium halotolerans]|uniref:acetylxylan esterase n=1 Tax=Microbacterium halotolerans TaxID=246613 RepID=UPI000E6AA5EA|nr:acetylxylan esterase [Microbacterium halotolerans]